MTTISTISKYAADFGKLKILKIKHPEKNLDFTYIALSAHTFENLYVSI